MVLGVLFLVSVGLLTAAFVTGHLGMGPEMPQGPPIFTYTVLAFAASALFVRLVLPGWLVARCRMSIVRGDRTMPLGMKPNATLKQLLERTGDAGWLWIASWIGRTMAAGCLMGAVFFCAVAYAFESSATALITGIVLTLAMVTLWPSRSGIFLWIEEQLRRIEQRRQLGA